MAATLIEHTIRRYVLVIVPACLLAAINCAPFRKVDLQPAASVVSYRRCSGTQIPSGPTSVGSPKDLKGLTKVFIDVAPRPTADEFKSLVATAAEEHAAQIVSTLSVAKLPLVMVSRPEEAEVILSFCTNSLRPRCYFSTNSGDYSDSANGEVYAVLPSGPRLLMRFTDRCTLWNRELGKAFAEAFIEAYRVTR